MRVLGVDGGTHTGVSFIDTEYGQVAESWRHWMFEGRGWLGEVNMAVQVVSLAEELGIHVLCLEDFLLWNPQSAKREGLSSPRVVAMVDAILATDKGGFYGEKADRCESPDWPGYVYRRARQASDAKTTWTNDRLLRKGFELRGVSAHEVDALRHAMLFAKSGNLL